MFSHKDRMRAVKLYIKYDFSVSAVIRKLGYPSSRQTLVKWYEEYKVDGHLHQKYNTHSRFTGEQKREAIKYYLAHGKNAAKTVKALGYPNRTTFFEWLDEAFPYRKKRCLSGSAMVECSQETKKQAVIDLCARRGSAQKVADAHHVSRISLYKWKKDLLGEERGAAMPEKKTPQATDVTALEQRIAVLQAEEAALNEKLHRAQLEYDILEKAAELLKKDPGINRKTLNNREKAVLIDALRVRYPLKELLEALCMPKSSYCYQENAIQGANKYARLRTEIYSVFRMVDGRYGYRRIHALLKKTGISVSEKVVRRLMSEENLIVRCVKRKKYNSYAGEISPEVANIVNRDFHAEKPNVKWLTDITEFSIPAGKVYLSPMIDCFDGMAVSWSIGTSPSAALANTMLDEAISILKEGEHPIIHSDRGSHYRWPGWIERTETAGLTRSMSRKGCSPDNSACEGFFGRLKNEMFYGRPWKGVSLEAFIATVNRYIRWYNEERIKESLGWMSPIEYRHSLGLAA